MGLKALFGLQSPQEQLRKHKRSLDKAIRDLDRERQKLEQQEKKLIADIKKSAKAGQNNACKIQAKDLVRTRKFVQKFYQMKTQLQGVSLRMQTMQSNQAMADAMKGVSRVMRSMNARINLPGIQKIMMDFEKESGIMDMKEEMMNDTIDDALDEDNDEEESEQIVQQVLDEIGISLDQALPSTGAALPTKASAGAENTKAAVLEGASHPGPSSSNGGANGGSGGGPKPPPADDDDLLARLNNLRKT